MDFFHLKCQALFLASFNRGLLGRGFADSGFLDRCGLLAANGFFLSCLSLRCSTSQQILSFQDKIVLLTKGIYARASLIYVDKMLNAFTMHSFLTVMPSKKLVTMPFGIGAFHIYTHRNNSIHLFIHQTHSL